MQTIIMQTIIMQTIIMQTIIMQTIIMQISVGAGVYIHHYVTMHQFLLPGGLARDDSELCSEHYEDTIPWDSP